MTGPEHYRMAERYLEEMEGKPQSVARGAAKGVDILTNLAQVHATLALAAATALPSGLFDDWRAVAESPGSGQTGDPS